MTTENTQESGDDRERLNEAVKREFTITFDAAELAAVGLALEDMGRQFGMDPNVTIVLTALKKVYAAVDTVPEDEKKEIASALMELM